MKCELNEIKDLVEKVLADLNTDLKLYDINYFCGKMGMTLQVLLQSDHFINTNELVKINQCLSEDLDKIEDKFDDSYTLEVASAGLEREIRNDEELAQAISKDIRVNCYRKFKKNKVFLGKLLFFNSTLIGIKQMNGNIIEIPREFISKLNYALIM